MSGGDRYLTHEKAVCNFIIKTKFFLAATQSVHKTIDQHFSQLIGAGRKVGGLWGIFNLQNDKNIN